jgi:hypothetical protein
MLPVLSRRFKRILMLTTAPLAVVVLGVSVAAAPAYAAAPSYHLFNRSAGVSANCPYTGTHLYGQVGTANFSSPYDYQNVEFFNEWVGDLHYVKVYQEAFTSALVYEGCVNNDIDYLYYGYQMTYRIESIVYNCYGGGCTASVSYGPWKYGWP